MGQLYIPSEKEIAGPWLVGNPELEELDDIFQFIDIKLDESINLEIQELANKDFQSGHYKDLDTAIKEKRRYSSYKKVNRVILISSDEKRLIDNTIRGVLRDSKLKDFSPKEISFDIEYNYDHQFSLNIKRRFDGALNYKVKCFDQECREEIKYKIESWLEKNQPNKPKQIWSQLAFLFFIIGVFTASVSSSFIITSELPDFKTIYKNDINEIIKYGVNENNEAKSIELLLKFVTDYKPPNIKEIKKINRVPIQIFSISVFLTLVSIFRPKTTIGIGKHKSLVKFYRLYTSFVLITLPLTFIIPPLVEWIKTLMKF